MHLYPSISSELELAGKLIIPLLVFHLIALQQKKERINLFLLYSKIY